MTTPPQDSDRQHVFGYGSLLERRDAGSTFEICRITGHRRVWNVAMDNTVDLPGYKHYVDPRTRHRPAVFVAFLNIQPAPGGLVNGVLIDVSDADLAVLDARERNYARIDVSAALTVGVPGRVWAYAGRPEAIERCRTGLRTGRAVIQERYYEHVRRQFAGLHAHGLEEFERLTAPPPCPIVDLCRVDP